MSRIVALLSGGDWSDARIEHLVIPDDMSLESEEKSYRAWYEDEYRPMLLSQNRLDYLSFSQWLISKGARKTTEEEVLEYQEN